MLDKNYGVNMLDESYMKFKDKKEKKKKKENFRTLTVSVFQMIDNTHFVAINLVAINMNMKC